VQAFGSNGLALGKTDYPPVATLPHRTTTSLGRICKENAR
jgi:hypothetical protein